MRRGGSLGSCSPRTTSAAHCCGRCSTRADSRNTSRRSTNAAAKLRREWARRPPTCALCSTRSRSRCSARSRRRSSRTPAMRRWMMPSRGATNPAVRTVTASRAQTNPGALLQTSGRRPTGTRAATAMRLPVPRLPVRPQTSRACPIPMTGAGGSTCSGAQQNRRRRTSRRARLTSTGPVRSARALSRPTTNAG